MNDALKKILMPVFRHIANPGIGNPHSPYEAELMAAGVKPIAVVGTFQMLNEGLSQAIKSGKVVVVASKIFDRDYALFHHPSQKENAEKAVPIYQSYWLTGDINEEQNQFLNSFVERPLSLKTSLLQRYNSPIHNLINGKMTCVQPVLNCDDFIDKRLAEAVENGSIESKKYTVRQKIIVLAQADKIDDARELYDRCYNEGKNSPTIEDNNEWNARIGKLFGYTDNDIAWSNGTKYQNPIIAKLMYATMDFRAWTRKEVMLNKANSVSECTL